MIIWLLQGATPRRQGSPQPPISPGVQHPTLFTTPPPSGLGLWCQAHVTISMLCNELLKPFQPSEIHLMVVTWPLGRQITSFVCLSVGGLWWVGVPRSWLTRVSFLPISAHGEHSLSLSLSPWLRWPQGFPPQPKPQSPPHTRIPPQWTMAVSISAAHFARPWAWWPMHLTLILSLFTPRNRFCTHIPCGS